MRKILSLLVAAVLCCSLVSTAFAASGDYTFSVQTEGSPAVGDTITVTLSLSKSGAGEFDLYAMQDYVRFDPAYFTYVDQSLSVYTVKNGEQERAVFSASPLDFDADGVIDRVYVNRASTSAETLASGVQVMEFKLKVKTQGSSALTQGGVEIFQDPAKPDSYSAEALIITIRNAGSTDSSNGSNGSVTTPAITVPVSSEKSTVKVDASVSNGTVSVEITDKQLDQVVSTGSDVIVDVSGLQGVDRAKLPASMVEKTERFGADLTVSLPTGSVTLDAAALTAINAKKDMTVSVQKSTLTAAQREAVSSLAQVAAVVDVNVLVGNVKQSTFGTGKLTISIPYTPYSGEDLSKLQVWFIRDDGSVENKGGYYDTKSGCFVFQTDHLSRYLLVYTAAAQRFVDVPAGSYFDGAVTWASDKGITTGTDAAHFSPDALCTRGQIVTFLWRAAGSPMPKSPVNPFTDVTSSDYYYYAVLWAVENGVTKGTSTTAFSPDATCTRGQAVTFLCRAVGSENAAGSSRFVDVPNDAFYAGSVNWAVANGVTKGTSETTFSPNASCTRAEIVTFLYRTYQGK